MPDRDFEPVSARPWILFGAGYTGMRLASRLVAGGARVVAGRRNPEALAGLHGVEAVAVNLEKAGTLAGVIPAGAVVVDLVPPGANDDRAERNLVAAAAEAGAHRLVYVSSTGVYGPADGAWVDEETPTDPYGPRGARRLAAETALLDAAAEAGLPAVSLRVAGIYGPGRGVVARMRSGDYRIIGDGDTYVSRVHVYDLCSAILAAGTIRELPRRCYTVADDEPTTSTEYAEEVARRLDLPAPPKVPASEVSTSVAAMLGANRRISNRRLKQELGIELRYPSFRDSLDEL